MATTLPFGSSKHIEVFFVPGPFRQIFQECNTWYVHTLNCRWDMCLFECEFVGLIRIWNMWYILKSEWLAEHYFHSDDCFSTTTVMADIFQEGFWKRSNIFPGSHEKKKLKKKSKSEVICFDTAWFIAFGRYYVHPPTCVHATNTKININITFLMKMPQEEFSVCIVRYLT